ncbi:MAG: hypothetical protein V2A34_04620, partial [Lentisphaerota bacterium]
MIRIDTSWSAAKLYAVGLAALCAYLAGAGCARAGDPYVSDYLMNVATPTGFIRVLKSVSPVYIRDAHVTFETGSTLPLFQENDQYFIALADTAGEGERLCAFPVMVNGERLAWITGEQTMVFAWRGSSCNGKVFLRMGEELPVIGETENDYEVVLERFGRLASLLVPKQLSSVAYTRGIPANNPLEKFQQARLPPLRCEIVMVGTNRAVTQKQSESGERLLSRLARIFSSEVSTGDLARIMALQPLDDKGLKPLPPAGSSNSAWSAASVEPVKIKPASESAVSTPAPPVPVATANRENWRVPPPIATPTAGGAVAEDQRAEVKRSTPPGVSRRSNVLSIGAIAAIVMVA